METNPDGLPEVLNWKVFPGANNTFEMVEEVKGRRCITKLILDWNNRKILIESSGEKEILPANRQHKITLYCVENQDGSKLANDMFCVEISDQVHLPVNEVDKQSMDEMIFERIDLPDISYDVKNQLWESLNRESIFAKKINSVKKFKDSMLTDMLFEVFYIEES